LYAPALVSSSACRWVFASSAPKLCTAPCHLECDGQGLAHGGEQVGGTFVPRLQAGQFEHAGDLADVISGTSTIERGDPAASAEMTRS